MERIKIPKADVVCWRKGQSVKGVLHLTQYHLIFRYPKPKTTDSFGESWIAYPLINFCTYRPSPPASPHPPAIRLRCRDFNYLAFHFNNDSDARAVFENIKILTCRIGTIERLYAFNYQSTAKEKEINGWALYDPKKEFARMGITNGDQSRQAWRISTVNSSYQYCDTYPAFLCVPSAISDTTLRHTASFRSKCRIPALTFKYPLNNCTITRSAQPNVGVRLSRSPQDERLVGAIFNSTRPARQLSSLPPLPTDSSVSDLILDEPPIHSEGPRTDLTGENDQQAIDDAMTNISLSQNSSEPLGSSNESIGKIYGAQQTNMIIDARPSVNAMANHAKGYGSERMEGYKGAQKIFLGIDNIHVMRSSLNSVVDAVKDCDLTNLPPDYNLLEKSKWRKHIGLLLEGTRMVAHTIAVNHSHVLIHCSDGWDRTGQLSCLSQLCLDPYYRTLEGIMVLIEKDFLSFGYMFRLRSGTLGHEKWFEIENDRTAGFRNENDGSLDTEPPANPFEAAISRAQMFFRRKADEDGDADSETYSTENSPAAPRSTKSGAHGEETKLSDVSPIFHQFLDAVYQLLRQFPTRFQFNERFLRRLLYHVYSCQYGTFLYNSEKERKDSKASEKTRSVWEYFLSRRAEFTNPLYDSEINEKVREKASLLLPNSQDIRWWYELFNRTDEEMNGPIAPPVIHTDDVVEEVVDEVVEDTHSHNVEEPQIEEHQRPGLQPMVSERLRPLERRDGGSNLEPIEMGK
jgi:myotubularin-related protein 6/7/8